MTATVTCPSRMRSLSVTRHLVPGWRSPVGSSRAAGSSGSHPTRPLTPRDVGHPAAHVLEADRERLVVWDVDDTVVRLPVQPADLFEDGAGEFQDRDLLGRADVHDRPERMRAVSQRQDGAHGVLDVAEAARLEAVAVDREALPVECLLHEAGDDHAVTPGLARADGVEEAN